jgi:EXPERA (EXPanded EBP superfamily)
MGAVPLRERRLDLIFVLFFAVNAGFVTYIVDLEALVIRDPDTFSYPIWPPAPLVDLIHWYGRTYDPLLMARPPFWQATMWIDVLLFGPFYLFAIYAFIRGRDWIRVPALVWSGMMMSNVLIILLDERYGVTPAPNFTLVVGFNLPWLLLPLAVIWRMRRDHPFSRPVAAPAAEPASAPPESVSA